MAALEAEPVTALQALALFHVLLADLFTSSGSTLSAKASTTALSSVRVESLLFLGTAAGSSDRCEVSERVSKEGEEVFDRSLDDCDQENGER